MSEPSPRLLAALQACWSAANALPDDDDAFAALDAHQRREAHDVAVRLQDRVTRVLAELSVGMAADGAELVDGEGLPAIYGEAPQSR